MEGGAAPPENNLTFPLYVDNTPVNVVLGENSVSWTKGDIIKEASPASSPKKTAKVSSKSFEWRYMLAARIGETNSTLEVFFIEKKPKNVWVKSSQKFQGIEVNCRECAQAIAEKLESLKDRPQNLLIFVNPVSGSAKNGVKIHKTQVMPLLELANISSETIVTEYAGHIKKYIQEKDLSRYDGVMIVGGDGTFTEAFTGLLLKEANSAGLEIDDPALEWRKPRMRIGIVPAGTGQGMVKCATGSKDVTTAILHIIVGSTFDLPVITVHNGGKFLASGSMLSGYGFFGDSIRDSEARRGLGIMRYPYGMLKTIINHRQIPLDVRYHPVTSQQESTNSPNSAQNGDSSKSTNCENSAHSSGETSVQNPATSRENPESLSESSNKPETPQAENSESSAKVLTEHSNDGGSGEPAKNGVNDVIVGADGAMENVDFSGKDTGYWVQQSGTYRGVHIFMLNLAAARGGALYESGGLSVALVKGAAGRLKHVGVILKTFDLLSFQGTSEEVAEFIEASAVEFTMKNQTEESLAQLAQTDKREVINVDGDPYTLLHPKTQIRKQMNVMQMFGEHGTDPFKW